MFHLDIMDGLYVPNLALGLQDLRTIRKNTDCLIDVHLMLQQPEKIIPLLFEESVDIIHFHPDVVPHPTRTISTIKAAGIRVGIAISPSLSLAAVKISQFYLIHLRY